MNQPVSMVTRPPVEWTSGPRPEVRHRIPHADIHIIAAKLACAVMGIAQRTNTI